ncbi:MAG TPA: hypothetical protein P5050_01070 [Bacteroidia bacterium]|nr:hypothetical protein [Sphingobacteriales bacterium]HPD63847.1 hypothetical protein [Bacteroidia bacterium]HRS57792.1 hypothetical protein [Bacteroidia bacterium]HRU67267.1 hypothetical protein [Bacteroidia bacterium]
MDLRNPKLPSFTRLPGYSQFEYRPRYSKPENSEEHVQEKRISFRKGGKKHYSSIKGQFTKHNFDIRKRASRQSFLLRLLILGLLLLFIYYLSTK